MPWTPTQMRLFQAKAHGAKYAAGPSQEQAKEMVKEGVRKRRAKKIAGGK